MLGMDVKLLKKLNAGAEKILHRFSPPRSGLRNFSLDEKALFQRGT